MTRTTLSVTGITAICCIFYAALAFGGGGINHKVKVTNDTDGHSAWTVYYSTFENPHESKHDYVGPKSSRTFEFGAACPYKVEVYSGDNKLHTKCTLGTSSGCTNTCWNTEWKLKGDANSGYNLKKD